LIDVTQTEQSADRGARWWIDGWMVTPFGVWSKEDWKLQGTQVDVKYHSSISPFTLFKPPVIR